MTLQPRGKHHRSPIHWPAVRWFTWQAHCRHAQRALRRYVAAKRDAKSAIRVAPTYDPTQARVNAANEMEENLILSGKGWWTRRFYTFILPGGANPNPFNLDNVVTIVAAVRVAKLGASRVGEIGQRYTREVKGLAPNSVGPRLIDPSTLRLPNGYSNSRFGDLLKWPKGTGDAAAKLRMAQDQLKNIGPEMIGQLKKEGVTSEMLKQWIEFYRAEAIRVPQNPTAAARAFYLEELLKLMGG